MVLWVPLQKLLTAVKAEVKMSGFILLESLSQQLESSGVLHCEPGLTNPLTTLESSARQLREAMMLAMKAALFTTTTVIQ